MSMKGLLASCQNVYNYRHQSKYAYLHKYSYMGIAIDNSASFLPSGRRLSCRLNDESQKPIFDSSLSFFQLKLSCQPGLATMADRR